MKERFTRLFRIVRDAVRRYGEDDASLLGGAISFFAFLSLAPTLLVAVVVAGWILGQERATQEVMQVGAQVLGPEGEPALRAMLEKPSIAAGSVGVAIGGMIAALYGASRAFVQLQAALNRVWEVRPRTEGPWRQRLRQVIRKRAASILIVLSVALAVLASVVLRIVLGIMEDFTAQLLGDQRWLWLVIELAASTVLLAAFLALVYRVLPDADVAWRDVFAGALTSALLLALGTKALSWYLTEFAARSVSGAAGTIVVTLLWLYYTSLVMLFGAEITAAVAHARGQPVEPEPHAERIIFHADPVSA